MCPLLSKMLDTGGISAYYCDSGCAWFDMKENQCMGITLVHILHDIKLDIKN